MLIGLCANELVLYSGVQKIQRVILAKTGSYFHQKNYSTL